MKEIHEHPETRCRSAFTLIELLVVIAIIAVLIALLVPAVQKVRETANRAACLNNLKQLALAAHNYHDARKQFPTGLHMGVNMGGGCYAGGTTWMVELLPYIEQDNLQKQWDYNDFRNNVAREMNSTTAQIIPIHRCPSDQLNLWVYVDVNHTAIPEGWGYYGLGTYCGNAGRRSYPWDQQTRDGIFALDSKVRLADVTDGSSNTLLFGERSHRDPEYDRIADVRYSRAFFPFFPLADRGNWGAVLATLPGGPMHNTTLSSAVPINYRVPADTPAADEATIYDRLCAFGSSHLDGANFAFADGSGRFVSESIPLPTLKALSTRAGGEVVPGDF
jgi:prepilin-type N-terminal cleavage/methylation domain-containing protein/prepilin-type processing-associated H-X9-DG protein